MSGLTFEREEAAVALFVVQDRWCLTEDDRLVPEGDPAARWLFAVPGQEIPLRDAVRYGLASEEDAPVTSAEDASPGEPEVAATEDEGSAVPSKRGGKRGK